MAFGSVNAPGVLLPTDVGADPAGTAESKANSVQTNLNTHTKNKSNPHSVTCAQIGAVPTGRKINGKPLTGDISLTPADIGVDASVNAHINSRSNPHGVTAAQAGALAADGTAVAAKKLSTARQIDGVNFDGSGSIHHYAKCSTAADDPNKTVTLNGFNQVSGARIVVSFEKANTASNPKLSVNGGEAYSICYKADNGGNYSIPAEYIRGTIELICSPSVWFVVDHNACEAASLRTARTIQTNLGSTSATSFNGTANVAPGVTGTLGTGNGGTGSSDAAQGFLNLFNALSASQKVDVIRRMSLEVSEVNVGSGDYILHTYGNSIGKESISKLKNYILGGVDLSGYASKSHSHAASDITSGILAVARGGLGNSSGYVRVGQKDGESIGVCATAEGNEVVASGQCSHAEGGRIAGQEYGGRATGYGAHAEGASGVASNTGCHAEGVLTTASGYADHAEGDLTTASGGRSHAEGYKTLASGKHAHAEGFQTTASGENAHAGGYESEAKGFNSAAFGAWAIANMDHQFVVGFGNVISDDIFDKFIVGGGSNDTGTLVRSNSFRVNQGGVYASRGMNSYGADYAEMFQWQDGNPNNEDRIGLFIALDGEKIRLANADDEFILGITSGNPSVVGDVCDDQWKDMYLLDIYGRLIFEDVEVPAKTEEQPDPENPDKTITVEVAPAHTERRRKLNPAYDSTQEYIPRSKRPEWGTVGMLGKLVVIDDGTCEVNGWCKPADGGIATASAERTHYRVMSRLDATHIRVLAM